MPTYKVYDRSEKGRLLGELRLTHSFAGDYFRAPVRVMTSVRDTFLAARPTDPFADIRCGVVEFKKVWTRETQTESETRRVIVEELILTTDAKLGDLLMIKEFKPEGEEQMIDRYGYGRGIY